MAPSLPGSFTVAPPPIPATTLVPVAGPPGPPGVAGDGTGMGFVYTTSTPATLHQIHHNMPFNPSGVIALETDGGQMEWASITYPSTGITEITFGVPFAGTIYLS